jgi:hypothetical protein
MNPTTRRSLHAVAEHVMATASYAAIGRIGLRPHAGGFATQEFDGRVLAVADGALDGTPIDGKTLRELGARDDVTLPYAPQTPFDDRRLSVDAKACSELGEFYALVAAALPTGGAPQQIWPEHFDLATDLNEVNFGGSPGDDTYPEPYLYVGPWDRSDTSSFDDPWGWTLHYRDIKSADHAREFFAKHV